MKSLMLILSVVAVVMTADAYSSRSRSSWADVLDQVESKMRLAQLYKEIEDLEGLEKTSRVIPDSPDARINNFFTRINVTAPAGITRDDFVIILQAVFSVETISQQKNAYVSASVSVMAEYNFEPIASTKDGFRSNINALIASDKFGDFANKIFPVFFSAVDTSDDGKFSYDEYSAVYNTLFLNSPGYALASFQAMSGDTANPPTATVSPCQYYAYATGYFTSTDAKYLYYWGVLLDA